jgi:spore germination cell wall hydrolase CwlJ-like protein
VVVLALFGTFMHAMMKREINRRELTCLAMNVYYEARGEPIDGQHGVAGVTMNRVLDSRYPNSICNVVHQKRWDYLRKRYVGAFSWTEFDSVPEPEGEAWHRAVEVAEAAIERRGEPMLQGAVHYHAQHIRPSWSRGKKPIAKIGRHVFYR